MNKGLLPITTLVFSDLAIDTGQLIAKQRRNRTSQILNSVIVCQISDCVFLDAKILKITIAGIQKRAFIRIEGSDFLD